MGGMRRLWAVALILLSGAASARAHADEENFDPFWGAALPPGTHPLRVADPVHPARKGDRGGFECMGACGASCRCVDRKEGHTETCENGLHCRWKTVSC